MRPSTRHANSPTRVPILPWSGRAGGSRPRRTAHAVATRARHGTAKAWEKARGALIDTIGKENIHDKEKVKSRAADVFKTIDTDGNGQIDSKELKTAMSNLGVELKNKEVTNMMKEADEDGCARLPIARVSLPSSSHARRAARSDMHIDLEEFIALVHAEVDRWNNFTRTSTTCSIL